jgi:hypothetical protein
MEFWQFVFQDFVHWLGFLILFATVAGIRIFGR